MQVEHSVKHRGQEIGSLMERLLKEDPAAWPELVFTATTGAVFKNLRPTKTSKVFRLEGTGRVQAVMVFTVSSTNDPGPVFLWWEDHYIPESTAYIPLSFIEEQ
jgi:hypothetical protein